KNRSAPSIKEEIYKIALHILWIFELMPKELVLEHRLVRGCEQSVMARALRLFYPQKWLFTFQRIKA
ncbi:hypothetical protein D920_01768, partial [Enterococcus faecalis 13-SD-W-01]